jgi:5-methylcytosine-specific restriction endonuclease McrA
MRANVPARNRATMSSAHCRFRPTRVAVAEMRLSIKRLVFSYGLLIPHKSYAINNSYQIWGQEVDAEEQHELVGKRVIQLADARARGLKFYFTGRPCSRGHVAERRTGDRSCVDCKKEAKPRHYRAWMERDPGAAGRKTREWRRANPGRAKELSTKNGREWREKNPERWQLLMRRASKIRDAREAAAPGVCTAEDFDRIRRMQNNRCAYCGTSFETERAVADHILPLARGGSHSPSNRQFLCQPCNRAKCAKDPIDFARDRGLLL